ncbi:MAG: DUF1631 family protein [Gammaproteobacteria bacterium]|nr:DUF1631 family protein [Gammaproteobacteria bacterium]
MPAAGAEKRRFTRHPLNLAAQLSSPGSGALRCTVRDFCEAGMFIALSTEQMSGLQPMGGAMLSFELNHGGQSRPHQLRVKVMRVTGSGLGVAFDDPPAEVLLGLTRLALSDAGKRTSGDVDQKFATEYTKVITPLVTLTRGWARDMFDRFAKAADDALFLAARDAASNAEQAVYLDAQTQWRKGRGTSQKEFENLLEQALRDLRNPLNSSGGSTQGRTFSSLSLVEKDEFEDFLTVSDMVSSIETRLKDALGELEKRLSFIGNKTVDASVNPLGPAVVCEIAAHTVQKSNLPREPLTVVLRTLSTSIGAVFNELVNAANRILIENGVLPKIEAERPQVVKKRESASPGRRPDAATDNLAGTLGGGAGYAVGGSTSPGQAPAERTGPGAVSPGPAFAQPPGPSGVAGSAAAGQFTSSGVWPAGGSSQPAGGYPHAQVAAGAGLGGYDFSATAGSTGVAGGVAVGGSSTGTPGVPAAGMAFSSGGFVAPPTIDRAYGAAQHMMAIRRRLADQLGRAIGVSGGAAGGGLAPYSSGQIVDGLHAMQADMLDRTSPQLFDVESIKSRIFDALGSAGVPAGSIGDHEQDAIEVIANLFRALIDDVMVPDAAKAQLRRMQPSVYKAGLLDPRFFESAEHPARQVLDRVAAVRAGLSPDGYDDIERVSGLIDRLNRDFNSDINIFGDVLNDLDDILRAQRAAFDANVANVVKTSSEQNEMLKQRRGTQVPGESTEVARTQEMHAEWSRWLKRGKELHVGDRFVMNPGRNNSQLLTLAWVGEGFDPYVFVDNTGAKAQTLTLQQVAMYLRRGILKLLDEQRLPPINRAFFGMLNRMHGELESEVVHDHATGMLNRKNFIDLLDRTVPQVPDKNRPRGAVGVLHLRHLADLRRSANAEVADAVLKTVADTLTAQRGRLEMTAGRLTDDQIGIYVRNAALEPVYKFLESTIEKIHGEPIRHGDVDYADDTWCGIAQIQDGSETGEQLVEAAVSASESAHEAAGKRLFVAGVTDARNREQFEQLVGYVKKAVARERLTLLFRRLRAVQGSSDSAPALHLTLSGQDRNGKMIPPELFMRAVLASTSRLEVDQWTIRNALKWMADNEELIDRYDSVVIPLSGASIQDEMLTQFIVNELMETPVPPGKLAFSMNDSDANQYLAGAMELVRTLREFGCRFVLDEFGTGQGSYDYVKELQVDFVSIQSIYFSEAATSPAEQAMVRSINELVHFMGKRSIARLKPSVDATARLKELGIDFIHEIAEPQPLTQA